MVYIQCPISALPSALETPITRHSMYLNLSPCSPITVSSDPLAQEVYQYDAELRHEYRADKGTDPTYSRILEWYKDFLIADQKRCEEKPKQNDKVQKTKAKGAISDTFTEAELVQMTKEQLCHPNGKRKRNIHTALCNHVMLLFTTAMALRGDDTRSILPPDIQIDNVPMLDIEPGLYIKALTVLSDQGKTNTMSPIDCYAALHHLDVHCCPIGAIALHLFS
ncbi:hypothetical protein BJ165DRAFT_1065432 [Panaeolus papilionaceus]|nr:hypothetical protein BJ165DRAFT_1065432 [Panaeolus papilionaceus]